MKSPCIKVCKIVNEVCIGCDRTLNQIQNWTNYTDKQRENIMNNLELKVRLENLESTMDNEEITNA